MRWFTSTLNEPRYLSYSLILLWCSRDQSLKVINPKLNRLRIGPGSSFKVYFISTGLWFHAVCESNNSHHRVNNDCVPEPVLRCFQSVQFSCSVVSDSLQPHGLQHARPPCPSSTPGVYSNSCPLSRWCHPAISSSVIRFSSCLQSFPASGSFQISQLFTSPKYWSSSFNISPSNEIQDWFPLGWTGWISLQSTGLS